MRPTATAVARSVVCCEPYKTSRLQANRSVRTGNRAGKRNHYVLDGGPMRVTLRGTYAGRPPQLIIKHDDYKNLCAAAMHPFTRLLWTLVLPMLNHWDWLVLGLGYFLHSHVFAVSKGVDIEVC